ncbi:MAG TPA: DUF1778 domain-containing protein [Rhodocyclaceae bacterium]
MSPRATATLPAKPPSPDARSSRLGLRAAPGQEALLRRAAQAANKSLTEFILDSACAVAEQTLLDQRYFLVEQAQWQAFNAALDRPAKVKLGLKKLMQHKAPWER